MWDAKTKPLVTAGKLEVFGLLQEQHPHRARLFSQWKKLSFPLYADPLNTLDVAAVPITLLVDEKGVIRFRNPNDQQLATFIKTKYTEPAPKAKPVPGHEFASVDELVLKGKLQEAITAYHRLLEKDPKNGRLHFRLGCTYRMVFDADGKPEHFTKAAHHWRVATNINGGQYIWRRRIQQYGPLTDKPYPFYDWVPAAQAEIEKRGEKAIQLKVPLSYSEQMGRNGKHKNAASTMLDKAPDGLATILKDDAHIQLQAVVLPSRARKSGVYRVHLVLKPNGKNTVWNNESDPVQIWIGKPQQGHKHPQGLTIPTKALTENSDETRSIEFDWHVNDGKPLTGYAIYHLCDKKTGQCTIRKQAFTVKAGL